MRFYISYYLILTPSYFYLIASLIFLEIAVFKGYRHVTWAKGAANYLTKLTLDSLTFYELISKAKSLLIICFVVVFEIFTALSTTGSKISTTEESRNPLIYILLIPNPWHNAISSSVITIFSTYSSTHIYCYSKWPNKLRPLIFSKTAYNFVTLKKAFI